MIYKLDSKKQQELLFWKRIDNLKIYDIQFVENLLFIITNDAIKLIVLDFEDDYLILDIASYYVAEKF